MPDRIILRKNEATRIMTGHPWIYHNEIERFEGKIISGSIVSVFAYEGFFVGKGFLNTASKIFVRILTWRDEVLDRAFFKQRIDDAFTLRQQAGFEKSYRAFFAEADGIPGFIVDKYDDYLVIQILSLGVERLKTMLIDLLVERYHPKGIYQRVDEHVHVLEGLVSEAGVVYGAVPESVEIQEGDCRFLVNIREGQKTGMFLDQSRNRLAIRKYAKGRTVLDCFAHLGQFAIQAMHAGASSAVAIDISPAAIEGIERNARLNDVPVTAIRTDVFSFLREEVTQEHSYGMIILDPPAFTKTSAKVAQAIRGYKEINVQALKLIEEGGYLVSASCSQHIPLNPFIDMIREAANDTHKRLQLLETLTQPQDHPILLSSPETMYLKLLIIKVTSL
jgi:23S rRNA (cytosine1962-C5)-methyltransferase